MRNVVAMVVSAILGVLSLMVVMSISGRSDRSMELKSNFSSVLTAKKTYVKIAF